MDFGNCVLRPAVRAEPIRARLEIRLKDGLEHQFQASLDHPVGDGGDGDFILPPCRDVFGVRGVSPGVQD